MLQLEISAEVQNLSVGLVEATGLTITAADGPLQEHCRSVVESVRQRGSAGGEPRRQAVRALLRCGGFRPAGRNKPAQEYLLKAAQSTDGWPTILNAVDLLNVVSLQSGLPVSMLGLERAEAELLIRYGRPDEDYVFNASGQVLDVEGLVCLCLRDGDESIAVGSPVKDSQRTKVTPAHRHVLACLYAPRSEVAADELQRWTELLASELQQWCQADRTRTWVV